MRSLVAGIAILFTLAACDRPLIRPKGSDTEWQQRQEQLTADEQQEQAQEDREVRIDHERGHDPLIFNPANN